MKRSEKVVKNIPADFTNPDKAERWLEENIWQTGFGQEEVR